jgi:hypothetical protein
MVYSFNPGTPADRTDDWASIHACQSGGIVLMIRQRAAQLEAFCRQSGNFLPVCDSEFLFEIKNIKVKSGGIHF